MQIDTEKTIQFKISKGRRVRLFILYLAVTFMSAFILWSEYQGWNKGSSKALIGIGGLILGLSSSLAAMNRLINIADLTVELGPKGIFDRRICKYPIPWSEIVSISKSETNGQTLLMLEFTNEFEETQINSIHHLIMKFKNRRFGARGRGIDPLDFHVGYQTFNRMVHAYAKAHNCPATRD